MDKINYFVKLPSGNMMMVDNLFEYELLSATKYHSSFWKDMGWAVVFFSAFSLIMYLVCCVF